MEKYLKNPIILAIIVGAVIYVLMSYFYNPDETNGGKKSKNKKKAKKTGFFTDKRETVILVSAIVALGTWFLAKTYLVTATETDIVDISGMDTNLSMNHQNPLINSVLGPSQVMSNEAGILNAGVGAQQPMAQQFIQPQIGQPQIGQPQIGQPQIGQPQIGQPVSQPVGLPSTLGVAQPQPEVPVNAGPVNQPNPAIQRIQTAATQVGQDLGRSNLGTNVEQNVQAGGGFHQPVSTQIGKSYNLIGSGLDIPRSAIPKVLVDYNV
jgi:hypothetical protein